MVVVPIKPLFCPRCDKLFNIAPSNAENRRNLNQHVEAAHPDYLPLWQKD
jgi:uncharacterized C2H2 Zn-finger protein